MVIGEKSLITQLLRKEESGIQIPNLKHSGHNGADGKQMVLEPYFY